MSLRYIEQKMQNVVTKMWTNSCRDHGTDKTSCNWIPSINHIPVFFRQFITLLKLRHLISAFLFIFLNLATSNLLCFFSVFLCAANFVSPSNITFWLAALQHYRPELNRLWDYFFLLQHRPRVRSRVYGSFNMRNYERNKLYSGNLE